MFPTAEEEDDDDDDAVLVVALVLAPVLAKASRSLSRSV